MPFQGVSGLKNSSAHNANAVVVPIRCLMAAAVGSGALVAEAMPGILAAAGFQDKQDSRCNRIPLKSLAQKTLRPLRGFLDAF